MATIKTGARLFKATINQIHKTSKKISKTIEKIAREAKRRGRNLMDKLRSFLTIFSGSKRKKPNPILINLHPKQKPNLKSQLVKKSKKSEKARAKKKQENLDADNKSQKKYTSVSLVKNQGLQKDNKQEAQPMKIPLPVDAIKNFYREWEENWGPALNPLDKEFLESAIPETVAKVIAHGRLTLKSPYLKAVYNGLKDLEEISDLLENEQIAKDRVMPVLEDYWNRKPDNFTEFLFFMHDKGIFPTRSGDRKLSLDPRLVPEWLGLVG